MNWMNKIVFAPLALILALSVPACATDITFDTLADGSSTSEVSGETAGGAKADAKESAERKTADEQVSSESAEPVSIESDLVYRLLVAEIAGQRKMNDVAVDQYLLAAFESPYPELAKRATRIALFAKDLKAALKAAGRWQELAPKDPEAVKYLSLLNLRLGHIKPAARYLRRFVSKLGDTPVKVHEIATLMLLREANKDAAMRTMELLLSDGEVTAEGEYGLARIAQAAKKSGKARSAAERALMIDEDHVGARLLLAQISLKADKIDEAIKYVQEALQRRPDDADIRLNFARLLLQAKRHPEAQTEFEKLVDETPDNADALYALGLLVLENKQIDKSKALFKRLVKLGKRNNEAAFYLGRIAASEKKYTEALEWFNKVKGGELAFESQVQVAQILVQQDKLDLAQTAFRKLRKQRADLATRIYLIESETLRRVEANSRAMAILNEALKHYPDDKDLLYARALLGEHIDQLDILERDLSRVLELDPENVNALNALGYTLADRTDRFEEAMELVKKAFAKQPDDAAILDSMGWVNFRLGKLEDSVRYLKRALKAGWDGEIAAHLGEVLWTMGKKQEAREIFKEAMKRMPDDQVVKQTIERLSPLE